MSDCSSMIFKNPNGVTVVGRKQRHLRSESVLKAMAVFWRKGFDGTSMKDLEQCMEMHPGSIYANFGSKQALYAEALDCYAEQSALELAALMKENGFLSGLRSYLTRCALPGNDDSNSAACMLGKTLSDGSPGNKNLKEKAEQVMQHFEAFLIEQMGKAIANQELPEKLDKPCQARFIQSQIFGLRCYSEADQEAQIINTLLDDTMKAIEALIFAR